jgi:molybdopterin-guanine dinucleotide biosynthesis protein A
VVGILQSLFSDIVVVAAPGQSLPPMPVRIVHDIVAGQGPVAGVLHGLSSINGDSAFVTSCDAAFLHGDLIAYLVEQNAADYEAVVPRWAGRLQPLHAVYRRTVVPRLAARLARGELRLVPLLNEVRTRIIDEEEIRRFDPDGWSFFNMNTPEHYAEALKRDTMERLRDC